MIETARVCDAKGAGPLPRWRAEPSKPPTSF